MIGRSEHYRWMRVNRQADRSWDNAAVDEEADATLHNEHKTWSEAEIRRALDMSRSVRSIAADLGRSIGAVESVRSRSRRRRKAPDAVTSHKKVSPN